MTRLEASKVIPEASKQQIVAKVKETGSNIEFEQPGSESKLPPVLKEEILSATHEATVEGNRMALALTIGFTALALGFSSVLPNIKNLETAKKATIISK